MYTLKGFCIVAIWMMVGCISASKKDTVPGGPGDISTLAYLGIEKINTGACTPFQIRLLNSDEQIITATETMTVSISATGNANLFSDSQCQTQSQNITIEKNDFRGIAFVQNQTIENFDLRYQGDTFITLAVTRFSDAYLSESQLDDRVRSIETVVEGSGSIYVGGHFTQVGSANSAKVAKLFVGGTLDTSFAVADDFLKASNPTVGEVRSIISTPTGVYLGGAMNHYQGSNNFSIKAIALDLTGQRDLSFRPINVISQSVHKIQAQANHIWMAGCFYSVNVDSTGAVLGRIFKLNTNALIDLSFDTQNQIKNDSGGGSNTGLCIYDFEVLDNGKVLIVGNFGSFGNAEDFTPSARIMRLHSNGTLDETFEVGDGFSAGGSDASAYAMVVDKNGKIYVGGVFGQYDGVSANRFIRLNANGTRDQSFDMGTGFVGGVYAIEEASNGKIYVGGNFTQYNGTSINGIARLNSDGSLDETFDVGSGFDDTVRVIKIADDASGDLWVGGDFETYDNTAHPYLIRLDPNGQID